MHLRRTPRRPPSTDVTIDDVALEASPSDSMITSRQSKRPIPAYLLIAISLLTPYEYSSAQTKKQITESHIIGTWVCEDCTGGGVWKLIFSQSTVYTFVRDPHAGTSVGPYKVNGDGDIERTDRAGVVSVYRIDWLDEQSFMYLILGIARGPFKRTIASPATTSRMQSPGGPRSVRATHWAVHCGDGDSDFIGCMAPYNVFHVEFRGDGTAIGFGTHQGDRLTDPLNHFAGTWKQDRSTITVTWATEGGAPDPYEGTDVMTLSDASHIHFAMAGHDFTLLYISMLDGGDDSTPEKTIEFQNMHSNPKIVEVRDGAAGTGDTCDSNDYILTKHVTGRSTFVMACGNHVGFCFRWMYEGDGNGFGPWIGASCSDHQFDPKTQRKRIQY